MVPIAFTWLQLYGQDRSRRFRQQPVGCGADQMLVNGSIFMCAEDHKIRTDLEGNVLDHLARRSGFHETITLGSLMNSSACIPDSLESQPQLRVVFRLLRNTPNLLPALV
jgi:hypothetical protein